MQALACDLWNVASAGSSLACVVDEFVYAHHAVSRFVRGCSGVAVSQGLPQLAPLDVLRIVRLWSLGLGLIHERFCISGFILFN